MTAKKQLGEKITILQAEYDAMPDAGINYKPEMGESYFFAWSGGRISSILWTNDEVDQARYEWGNCYPTEEVAEQKTRNRKRLVKMREFAFVPNFEDNDQNKYLFFMDNDDLGFRTTTDLNYGSPVFFETDEFRYSARIVIGDAGIREMLKGGLV